MCFSGANETLGIYDQHAPKCRNINDQPEWNKGNQETGYRVLENANPKGWISVTPDNRRLPFVIAKMSSFFAVTFFILEKKRIDNKYEMNKTGKADHWYWNINLSSIFFVVQDFILQTNVNKPQSPPRAESLFNFPRFDFPPLSSPSPPSNKQWVAFVATIWGPVNQSALDVFHNSTRASRSILGAPLWTSITRLLNGTFPTRDTRCI